MPGMYGRGGGWALLSPPEGLARPDFGRYYVIHGKNFYRIDVGARQEEVAKLHGDTLLKILSTLEWTD